MALNFDKLRDRLNKSQNQEKGNGTSVFWKPDEGTHTIRVVDPGTGDPFRDFYLHYNVGKNFGFLCPKRNFGDECPVCEFASKLWTEGNEDEKNQAKKLFVKQRFYTTIVVRGEEDTGAKLWSHGKEVFENLLRVAVNTEEYGDITDVKDGTDFTVEYKTPEGASFPKTSLTPKRKTSPLAGSKKEVDAILENVPNVDEILERKTTEQVEKMLNEWLHSDKESEGKPEKEYNKPTTTQKKDDSKDKSVDEAFDELLND